MVVIREVEERRELFSQKKVGAFENTKRSDGTVGAKMGLRVFSKWVLESANVN